MSVNTTSYLNEIASGFSQAIDEVTSLCGNASETQLTTPEAQGKWNMLQCIEHMSLATELYIKNIGTILKASNLPPANQQYKGHWKGRMFAKMNAPKSGGEIPMKLKTFKTMEPLPTLDKEQTIQRFCEVHQQLIDIVNESRSVNIDKIKVATALGSMVKLRVGEAYRFILAHTQRHMTQLKRIKNTVVD